MGQLLFIASADAGSTLAPQNVYLSGANGNDANDGLTPATAVATFGRVWELLPLYVQQPFVVHIGEHGGVGYTYELPPEDRFFAEGAFIVLYGDGAGQAGEDGFTEVESGVAGAGTTVQILELAAAPADDAYWGYTVEYTSGAAVGLRRSIRDNAGALAKLVVGTETVTSTLTPVPGDSYRVLRPAVTLQMPDVERINRSFVPYVTSFSTSAPVHTINLRVESATSTGLAFNGDSALFGVELATTIRLIVGNGSFVASGVDGSATITGVSFPDLLELADPGHVIGQWNGWGVSQPGAATNGTGGVLYVSNTGSFAGFVNGGGILNLGAVILLGGRVGGFINNSPGYAFIGAQNVFSATDCAVPFLVESSSSGPISIQGGRITLSTLSTSNNVSLEVIATQANNALAAILATRGAFIDGNGVLTIDAPNTTDGVGLFLTDGSVFSVQNLSGASLLSINIPGGTGILCVNNSSCYMSGWGSLIAKTGIVVEGGALFDLSGTGQTAAADITASGIAVSVEGGTFSFAAQNSVWSGSSANGVVRVLRGGRFQQTEDLDYGSRPSAPGTLTVNNAGAGPAFEVSGGGEAYLRGGANTITTAGSYGIDARNGGRVYCGEQPSNVVGTTNDLIVDTVAGGQADAVLAASASAIYNATTNNGSIIARAS